MTVAQATAPELAKRPLDALDELSKRECQILGLIADGHSNDAIRARLWLSPRTVEAHVRTIFIKLGLLPSRACHRRVLAVRAYLEWSAERG